MALRQCEASHAAPNRSRRSIRVAGAASLPTRWSILRSDERRML